MSAINRLLGACLVAAMFLSAPVYAGTWSFNHQFKDHDALWWIKGQARDTFAVYTTVGANGLPASCPVPFTYDGSCWQYAPLTWDATNYYYFYFLAYEGSHYHLGFVDPAFNQGAYCFRDPGDGYGSGIVKRINGVCSTQIPDWAAEQRILSPHSSSSWVTTGLQNASTGEWRTFDITTITTGSTVPIQVWGMDQNGTWWYYPHLNGPSIWTFPAANLLEEWEIDIGVADDSTAGGPFTISALNMSIRDH